MNAYLETETLPVILLDTVSLMFPILSLCLRLSAGVKLILQKLQRKHVPTSPCTSHKIILCTVLEE